MEIDSNTAPNHSMCLDTEVVSLSCRDESDFKMIFSSASIGASKASDRTKAPM